MILLAGTTGASSGGNFLLLIAMYAVIIGALYFFMMKPQKKQEKQHREMLSKLEVGDSVLTSSGFYGVVMDITDDTVIVEFGSDRHCRIPMKKTAIVESEKPYQAAAAPAEEKKDSQIKK